jgi:hypothetical protein
MHRREASDDEFRGGEARAHDSNRAWQEKKYKVDLLKEEVGEGLEGYPPARGGGLKGCGGGRGD